MTSITPLSYPSPHWPRHAAFQMDSNCIEIAPDPPTPAYLTIPFDEDQEHNGDEKFVDSSLSVDEVIAWIADEAPGAVANRSGDEDEGIDGLGEEGWCRPTRFLELFNSLFATYTWTQWDGIAQNNMFKTLATKSYSFRTARRS